jgi:hypothetical protein
MNGSLSLPNELIIIIYKYANVETKYKLIIIYKWLLDIKLKCDNDSGKCNNDAVYILKFKLNLTHLTYSNVVGVVENNTDALILTKIICSLKCKRTLILEYITDKTDKLDLDKTDKLDKTNCKSDICINENNESVNNIWWYLLNYNNRGFYYGSFYYGNGYGNEWYNTDYRIQYHSKSCTNDTIDLEYYIHNQDKCFSCHQNIFCDRVVVKGFLLS